MASDMQFTDKAAALLQESARIASEYSHPQLSPLHFIAAMALPEADGSPSYLRVVIEKARYEWAPLERLINKHIVRIPAQSPAPDQVLPSPAAAKVLQAASKFSKSQKDSFIGQDHFLLALLEDRSVQDLLKEGSMRAENISNAVQNLRGNKRIDSRTADTSQEFEFLKKYATDLTELAREGKLDPVIGREEEIRRCIRVLSRRMKSNPCLLGDPGVGKTSVVEGVAQRIIDGDVPSVLAGCKLMSLDLGALKAGAKYQGDFEERIKGVLKEIEDSKDMIILFVDEIHMLMGDGKSDAANLLKPMLARGQLHCIGATTVEEYRKYIEKDAAFERRFQKVDVREPTTRETVAILRGLQGKYELHHGVRILDNALVAAAQLASRYLTYRRLPDSAVDLIDEAAASVAVARDSRPEQLDTLERQLQLVQVEISALERDTSDAAKSDKTTNDRLQLARQKAANLEEELRPLRERFHNERKGLEELNNLRKRLEELEYKAQDAERRRDTASAADLRYFAIPDMKKRIEALENDKETSEQALLEDLVTPEIIAETVARLTGIPVSKLSQAENVKLINMERELSKQVVGQTEAVKAVSNAIRLSRAGLSNPNAPSSFMFLGLSGSGKTELAKKLAGFLFADEKAMIRIDCSELGDKWSASKLLGAAPGYVGYEEGGILTEALLRRPYSVLLFDEVEKAAPEVLTVLLQLLDDGIIHASSGKLVNAANCIVIMTSNLGAEYIQATVTSHIDSVTKSHVMDAVRAHFRPEFLNRISSMVVFNRLSKKNIKKIVDLRIKEIGQRMEANNKNITITVDEAAKDFLCEHGYSMDMGARPLNRLIQNEVLNKLAVLILRNQVRDNEEAQVTIADDGNGLKVLPNHEQDIDMEPMEIDSDEELMDEDLD
ncbi:P-loop containing nucleoside triphosphate hydrolase protein [Kockiozyma suomiensis]|uniref:P-loop containing nucleoside triphosphate hydrolase protein n=1 Tax=Kockiozyma suomiensis TaxID=1337062 RepID=UPI0033434E1A